MSDTTTEFSNVTVTKAANVYFDGKVSSRKLAFADGSIKTLGLMAIGDYKFGTEQKELMEILAGDCEILLPNSDVWQKVSAGESFEVPANSSFEIKALTIVDYCCSYF